MDSSEFRAVGHRVVDLLAEYLDHMEERPVFPEVEPAALNRLFDEPLPEAGIPSDAVLEELERKLLPYCTHVGHPGYFGLITPSPNLMGILGDFICSGPQPEHRRLLHRPLFGGDGAPDGALAHGSCWLRRAGWRKPDELRNHGELHRDEAGLRLGLGRPGAT